MFFLLAEVLLDVSEQQTILCRRKKLTNLSEAVLRTNCSSENAVYISIMQACPVESPDNISTSARLLENVVM